MKLLILLILVLINSCQRKVETSDDNDKYEKTAVEVQDLDIKIVGDWRIFKYKYIPQGHKEQIDYKKDTLLIESFSITQNSALKLTISENGSLEVNDFEGRIMDYGKQLKLECDCVELAFPFACTGYYEKLKILGDQMILEQEAFDQENNLLGKHIYVFRRS